MLVENINYLRKNYPAIREQLKAIEESEEKRFQIEETKKGDKTLSYVKDGKKQYFHSKYDPTREAEVIAEEYTDLEGKTIVFYGTGLGYHIDIIVRNNPNSDVYIFEPIPELLEAFLSVQNLAKTEYKNVKNIIMGFENLGEALNSMLDINREDIELIALPSHKKLYESEHRTFTDRLMNITKNKRSSITTNHAFQKRWIVNSMKNFKEVLVTPNILIEKKGGFEGKPAIIVAAGPSLNEEIENIRYIKENRLAYIFTVGSAINTLIHHGIHPHAAATYDPQENNWEVFRQVVDRGIKEIPMIFGSSVGCSTLEKYNGKKYHMITSQDTVATYYLLSKDENMDIVSDAPSIAVVTLQLLANLGFSPIMLAGQNLGYVGKSQYADGITYHKQLTDYEETNALIVTDVYGNKIKTDDGFNFMRRQMEAYIAVMEAGRVINTTQGGAKIQGTAFRELKDIIDKDLKESVVHEDWLEGNKTNYNKETIAAKMKQMDQSLVELARISKEYQMTLENMYQLLKDGNIKQLELMYDKLNAVINNLQANDYFMIFILNMNRVYYDLLVNAVKRFQIEKNVHKKHKDLLDEYQRFIERCKYDIEDTKEIYEEMNHDVGIIINQQS